jgi:hypothetical protein
MDNASIILSVLCICLLLSSSIGVGAWFYFQEISQVTPEINSEIKPEIKPEIESTSTPVPVLAETASQVAKALDNYKMLTNLDYPGNDIKCYDDGKSTEECGKLCNDDKSCVGLVEVPKNTVWGEKSGCCIKNKFGEIQEVKNLNFYYKKDQTSSVSTPFTIQSDKWTPCMTNTDAIKQGYTWRDEAATDSCIKAGYKKWGDAEKCAEPGAHRFLCSQ